MRNGYRIEPTPAAEAHRSAGRNPRARKRPKDAPTHVRSWPLRPNPAQWASPEIVEAFLCCGRLVRSKSLVLDR
jgi:hypothetical protein